MKEKTFTKKQIYKIMEDMEKELKEHYKHYTKLNGEDKTTKDSYIDWISALTALYFKTEKLLENIEKTTL